MTHSQILAVVIAFTVLLIVALIGLIRCNWQAAEIADLRAQLAKEIQS